jgi:subtilase family serine protease
MTRSIQTKFEERVGTLAESFKLELVTKRTFSNAGIWMFQKENTLNNVLSGWYSFKDEYATFNFGGNPGTMMMAVYSGSSGYTTLEDVLSRISKLLTEATKDKPCKPRHGKISKK